MVVSFQPSSHKRALLLALIWSRQGDCFLPSSHKQALLLALIWSRQGDCFLPWVSHGTEEVFGRQSLPLIGTPPLGSSFCWAVGPSTWGGIPSPAKDCNYVFQRFLPAMDWRDWALGKITSGLKPPQRRVRFAWPLSPLALLAGWTESRHEHRGCIGIWPLLVPFYAELRHC
jgi:hypothetical protein